MKEGDRQLGKPARAYRDTKANIGALALGAGDEGCMAYAADTNEFGTFDGAAWAWDNPKTLVAAPGGTLTLDAAGAITVTHSYHDVDTFGSAATDNLDTINGGVDGQVLILCSTNSARDTTLTQAGNILLDTAGNFTLTNVADRIILQCQGGSWHEISRSDNS